MSNLVGIKNFETHNKIVAAGTTENILLANATIAPMGNTGDVNKPVPADGFYVTATGTAGDSIGIRVDSDPVETTDEQFFQIAVGTTILIRVPVKRKLVLKNSSTNSVTTSVAFVRGRNHF